MEKVKSFFEAVQLLEDNKVLVCKNNNKVCYLSLNSNGRIAFFNENVKYSISDEELHEFMKENMVFIFEGKENIGI